MAVAPESVRPTSPARAVAPGSEHEREHEKGSPMAIHPLHQVYLGVRDEDAETGDPGGLHPLHRIHLGATPGGTAAAALHGGSTRGVFMADLGGAVRLPGVLAAAALAKLVAK